MKQIKISRLIKELKKMKKKHGNQPVYYHLTGENCRDHPLEVEGVELRATDWGEDKVTIW